MLVACHALLLIRYWYVMLLRVDMLICWYVDMMICALWEVSPWCWWHLAWPPVWRVRPDRVGSGRGGPGQLQPSSGRTGGESVDIRLESWVENWQLWRSEAMFRGDIDYHTLRWSWQHQKSAWLTSLVSLFWQHKLLWQFYQTPWLFLHPSLEVNIFKMIFLFSQIIFNELGLSVPLRLSSVFCSLFFSSLIKWFSD